MTKRVLKDRCEGARESEDRMGIEVAVGERTRKSRSGRGCKNEGQRRDKERSRII